MRDLEEKLEGRFDTLQILVQSKAGRYIPVRLTVIAKILVPIRYYASVSGTLHGYSSRGAKKFGSFGRPGYMLHIHEQFMSMIFIWPAARKWAHSRFTYVNISLEWRHRIDFPDPLILFRF